VLDGPQGIVASPVPSARPRPTRRCWSHPSLVTLQNAAIPTNDPWLAPAATQTTGNNVDAYADFNSPDGFSGADLRAVHDRAGHVRPHLRHRARRPTSAANQRMAR
jgi:hypothetical protein